MIKFDAQAKRFAFNKAREVVVTTKRIREYVSSISLVNNDDEGVYEVYNDSNRRFAAKTISEISPELFAKKYFYKNVVKNVIACSIVNRFPTRSSNIVDLGCGSGAFTFAAYSVLNVKNFTAIDKNKDAVNLINLLHRLERRRSPTCIKANICDDVISVRGLVGISYVLVELNYEEMVDLANMLRVSPAATIVIVDYVDVVKQFLSILRDVNLIFLESIEVTIPDDLAEIVGDDRMSMCVCMLNIRSRF